MCHLQCVPPTTVSVFSVSRSCIISYNMTSNTSQLLCLALVQRNSSHRFRPLLEAHLPLLGSLRDTSCVGTSLVIKMQEKNISRLCGQFDVFLRIILTL